MGTEGVGTAEQLELPFSIGVGASMSDTPRCDAILYGARMVPVGAESMVEGYFARDLERELAAATERIAALERERDALRALLRECEDYTPIHMVQRIRAALGKE